MRLRLRGSALALVLAADCAPRAVAGDAVGPCGVGGVGALCPASHGDADGGPQAFARSRRFVLPATAVAFLQRGSAAPAGTLPASVIMGRAGDGPSAVLLRFDLPRGVDVLEAYLLVDRAEGAATEGAGTGLHVERIIGAWSPESSTWLSGPELREDPSAPSLVLKRGSPQTLRIAVTTAVRGPRLADEPPDHGLAIVADRATKTTAGVAIALAPRVGEPLVGDHDHVVGLEPRAPRLELYVK